MESRKASKKPSSAKPIVTNVQVVKKNPSALKTKPTVPENEKKEVKKAAVMKEKPKSTTSSSAVSTASTPRYRTHFTPVVPDPVRSQSPQPLPAREKDLNPIRPTKNEAPRNKLKPNWLPPKENKEKITTPRTKLTTNWPPEQKEVPGTKIAPKVPPKEPKENSPRTKGDPPKSPV